MRGKKRHRPRRLGESRDRESSKVNVQESYTLNLHPQPSPSTHPPMLSAPYRARCVTIVLSYALPPSMHPPMPHAPSPAPRAADAKTESKTERETEGGRAEHEQWPMRILGTETRTCPTSTCKPHARNLACDWPHWQALYAELSQATKSSCPPPVEAQHASAAWPSRPSTGRAQLAVPLSVVLRLESELRCAWGAHTKNRFVQSCR